MMAFVMVSERSKCRVYFTVDFGIPDHIPDRLRASHSHREEYRGTIGKQEIVTFYFQEDGTISIISLFQVGRDRQF